METNPALYRYKNNFESKAKRYRSNTNNYGH